MPTYHYRCSACGHSFDAFQRFSEDPLKDCPECDGTVRRVIQPVGVVFKGSGWYVTDSRPAAKTEGAADKGEKTEKTEKTDKPAADASAKKSETTDAKPAAPAKAEKVAASA